MWGDPHCHWCGCDVFEFVGILRSSPFQATVDHIKCRLECATTEEHRADSNKVLACYACNQKRNDAFHETWKPANDCRFNRNVWHEDTGMTCFELVMQPPSWADWGA